MTAASRESMFFQPDIAPLYSVISCENGLVKRGEELVTALAHGRTEQGSNNNELRESTKKDQERILVIHHYISKKLYKTYESVDESPSISGSLLCIRYGSLD